MAEAKSETKSKTKTTNPFIPEQMWEELGLRGWQERARAMGEAQASTVRHMTEQYLSFGRNLNEQLNSQMQVSAKLAKDGLDYGINLLDAWNRNVIEATESAIDNMTPRT
jgi:hypothetical protein